MIRRLSNERLGQSARASNLKPNSGSIMKSYIWLGLALAALAFFSVHALAGAPAEASVTAQPATVECCDDLECPPACCDLPCDPADCAPSDCLTPDCLTEECDAETKVATQVKPSQDPICNDCPGLNLAKTVWSFVAH